MNSLITKIIVGIVVAASLPTAYALDRRWNQQEAIMCTAQNKKMILELELQKICEKYNMNFPCSSQTMSPQDRGRYDMYYQWFLEIQKKLDKQMGG